MLIVLIMQWTLVDTFQLFTGNSLVEQSLDLQLNVERVVGVGRRLCVSLFPTAEAAPQNINTWGEKERINSRTKKTKKHIFKKPSCARLDQVSAVRNIKETTLVFLLWFSSLVFFFGFSGKVFAWLLLREIGVAAAVLTVNKGGVIRERPGWMELAEKKKIIGERELSKRAMAILRSISYRST